MKISKRGAGSAKHSSWKKGKFEITTDPSQIDLSVVHHFLTNCYWAKGVPAETVRRSIQHSLCFGIYHGRQQVGFARVITDQATFAYIGDVFVVELHRGKGLSKWLMQCIKSHPDLQGLRRWSLITRDAHGLYQQFGFTPLKSPQNWMEIHDAGVYERSN
ncbi:MAG TPA: GNAT family N-acetyltransferase [Candidatus Angelobacter sp.]|nr:GNAT family N-acetyltransferase [Candidatus Angelobacter sp.]